MQSKIEKLKKEMLEALKKAKSDLNVRDLEVKYLGRSGAFNDIMRSLKDLSDDAKRTVGKSTNRIEAMA